VSGAGPIRVVVADDHPLYRASVERVLRQHPRAGRLGPRRRRRRGHAPRAAAVTRAAPISPFAVVN